MTALAGLAAAPPRDRMHAAYVAALLLAEAILLIVLAKLVPKLLIGSGAEVLSVWAVGGALVLGFGFARVLGGRELSTRGRVFWGLAVTFLALQIIGRADLSESAAVWDMSWLIDLGSPSSEVWRRAGALDQFFAALTLIPIWFRGAALGTTDLAERPFTRSVLGGFAVLLFGFVFGDNAGIESVVQIAAIAWVLSCVVAAALKECQQSRDRRGRQRSPNRPHAGRHPVRDHCRDRRGAAVGGGDCGRDCRFGGRLAGARRAGLCA